VTWTKGPRHCTVYRVPGNEGSNWRALMSAGRRYQKLGRARVPRKLRGPHADYHPIEKADQRLKYTPLHTYLGDVIVWGERMLFIHRGRYVYVNQLFFPGRVSLRERLDRVCEILAAEDTADGRYDPELDALVEAVDERAVQRALDQFEIGQR